MIIDFCEIIKEKNIPTNGAIHIGAHNGQEIKEYEKCGFKNVLMVEANPETFKGLINIKSDICDLKFLNVAISDKKGISDFNVTSNNRGGGEMSSSLLKLKRHKQLYPGIQHSKTIKVETELLDNILDTNEMKGIKYNMLNLDIQGAELMALEGSVRALEKIDIINTEVNKTELYEQCVLIEELENFLSGQGFYKYSENYKYSPEWGDAIFLKNKYKT